MRDGWEGKRPNPYGARASACAAHMPTFRPEPRMEASDDFCIACLWSALGLTLTGLLFALGLGPGQILAMAG